MRAVLRRRPPRAVLYLVVGGLSYLVDVGLLLLLAGPLGAPLWAATTVGYWTSVVVNYGLNRAVVFEATGSTRRSATRYGLLLLLNYLLTLLLVTGLTSLGLPVVVAKTVAVGGIAVLNFFLYRAWVFA